MFSWGLRRFHEVFSIFRFPNPISSELIIYSSDSVSDSETYFWKYSSDYDSGSDSEENQIAVPIPIRFRIQNPVLVDHYHAVQPCKLTLVDKKSMTRVLSVDIGRNYPKLKTAYLIASAADRAHKRALRGFNNSSIYRKRSIFRPGSRFSDNQIFR